MEGGGRKPTVWKKLKRRLKLNNILSGLCGSSFALKMTDMGHRREDEDEDEDEEPLMNTAFTNRNTPGNYLNIGPIPAGGGMNLATALAAERQLANAGLRSDIHVPLPLPLPPYKSLVRLFEEIDFKKDDPSDIGSVCCQCMERDKGAALIPCGHTYCRVCSRELWLNQGSCPLCNRSVIEILDIF